MKKVTEDSSPAAAKYPDTDHYQISPAQLEALKEKLTAREARVWSKFGPEDAYDVRAGYGNRADRERIFKFEQEQSFPRTAYDRELDHLIKTTNDLVRQNNHLLTMVQALSVEVETLKESLELVRAVDIIKKLALDLQAEDAQ